MSYAVLSELKQYASISSVSDDDVLVDALNAAHSVIDNYTHRTFESSAETDRDFTRLEIPGVSNRFNGRLLMLDGDLAAAPSAITDAPTVLVLPQNEFPIYALLLTDGAWAYPTVTVTGHWAYSTSAPADIKQACLRLADWIYDLREGTEGPVAIVTPDGQVLVPGGLPDDVLIHK